MQFYPSVRRLLRINIKLKTGDSKNYMETEINGAGPVIDTEKYK